MLRVILIDDHPAVREGVRALLRQCGRPSVVVGEYGRFDDALAALPAVRANLVIADYRMPDMPAADFIAALRQRAPDLGVLFLSATNDSDEVKEVLRLGALGFLSKSATADELRAALDAARSGEVWVSADALSELMEDEKQWLASSSR